MCAARPALHPCGFRQTYLAHQLCLRACRTVVHCGGLAKGLHLRTCGVCRHAVYPGHLYNSVEVLAWMVQKGGP